MTKFLSKSPEETFEFARKFASKLIAGDIYFLIGNLGAGKTKFVQGLASGLNVPSGIYVRSPTFALINEYSGGRLKLFHADLYRLDESCDIGDLGLDEYFYDGGVTVVEWADKFLSKLPNTAKIIRFEILGDNERKIIF